MAENSSSMQSTFSAFLMGSILGLAAGMLLAPKSGQESREQLRQKLRSAKETAQNKRNQTMDTASVVAQESARAARDAKERIGNRTS